MQKPIQLKLVVVGDTSSGKTDVLRSFVKEELKIANLQVFERQEVLAQVNGKKVKLTLWDTAGQEEFNRLRPLVYPATDVFLIVFSVIDPVTFTNARKKWYRQVTDCMGNVPKIFVGTNIHLREAQLSKNPDIMTRPVSKQRAEDIITSEFQCKYMQCSSATNEGVKDIMWEAMRLALQAKLLKLKAQEKVKPKQQCEVY